MSNKVRAAIERTILEMDSGEGLDWNSKRKELVALYRTLTDDSDRDLCLRAYAVTMDFGESRIVPSEKMHFREARAGEYKLLLIEEASRETNDGNIHPEVIARITKREVAAGRMASDDDLHKFALAGEEVLVEPQSHSNPENRSVISKLRAWFGG